MRKIDFQTKASANRNKNKEIKYFNGVVSNKKVIDEIDNDFINSINMIIGICTI